MFEAQVVYYLNQYLGKYVYGLDAESLKISVWRGDVELRNLQLKAEALQELNLPITLKSGLLGRLTLKVIGIGIGRSMSLGSYGRTAVGCRQRLGAPAMQADITAVSLSAC